VQKVNTGGLDGEALKELGLGCYVASKRAEWELSESRWSCFFDAPNTGWLMSIR
jgi:hypothetical protein